MPRRPKVIIRSCPSYDVGRIRSITRDALDRLGLVPSGRVLLKPNVVASGDYFPHAYTRPELVEGVLGALRDRARGLKELAIGERCGITIPTRFAYGGAGYFDLARRTGTRLYAFEEQPQVEIPLYHPDRLRDSVFTPQPVAAADFFVSCPKFKAHPWTTVTFSLKSYIGIQDDRHRLLDHDHLLERKVADLQYILQPQLIVIDAIVAGEGRMLTPLPFDLGLVILGDNQVAFDTVCCHILGLDPRGIEHIRTCHERGFGPIDLDAIDVEGDVTLGEAQEKARGFRTGLVRVEEYFEGTSIRAYGGRPPGDSHDYCWGGCPGALEEAIEVLRAFDDRTDAKMPPLHLVFGEHDGPIEAKPGEKVVFVGDCARFEGDIAGRPVRIESRYVDRSDRHPLDAREEDVLRKMLKVSKTLWKARRDDVMRLEGCPVSVAEQVLALVSLGKLKNPYFEPSQIMPFMSAYLSTRTRQTVRRWMEGRFDRPGAPALRGAARPDLGLPPPGFPSPLEPRSNQYKP